jgi:hypothetical protein
VSQATYGEPDAIAVVITAADGRQYVHTTLLRDLEMETASHGGELSASWRVDAAEPYDNVLAVPSAEAELFDRAGRFRHLRLEHDGGDFFYREASLAFEARGFSSHAGDDRFTHAQVYPAGTPIENVFRHARDELCPLLSTSNAAIRPTGIALAADSEDFGGKTAKAVFNAMAALAGVRWHIWSQDAGRPYLEVVRPSTVADYVVRLPDQAAASIGWDLQNLYNRVLVKWSDGYAWADDMDSQHTYGLRRTYFVDRSQDLVDEGSAFAVASSLLGNFGGLPVDGFGVSLDYGVPLWDANGAQVPLWRANAGRTYELQGLVLGTPGLPTTFVAQQTIFSGNALNIVPIPPDVLTDLALSTR